MSWLEDLVRELSEVDDLETDLCVGNCSTPKSLRVA